MNSKAATEKSREILEEAIEILKSIYALAPTKRRLITSWNLSTPAVLNVQKMKIKEINQSKRIFCKNISICIKIDKDPCGSDKKDRYLLNGCPVKFEREKIIFIKALFIETGNVFELKGDLLEMTTNKKLNNRKSAYAEVSDRFLVEKWFNPYLKDRSNIYQTAITNFKKETHVLV